MSCRFKQSHLDFAGVGMPDDVRERLLKNAEKCRVQVLVKDRVTKRHTHAALDARLLLEFTRLPLQRRGQPGRVKQPGPQFSGDAADGLDRFVNVMRHPLDFFLKPFQTLRQTARQPAQLQFQPRERLPQFIVTFRARSGCAPLPARIANGRTAREVERVIAGAVPPPVCARFVLPPRAGPGPPTAPAARAAA